MKRLLSLISILPLVSCTSNFVLESKVFYFDTMVNIQIFEEGKAKLSYIKGILRNIDELTDNYHQRTVNNVYTINHTNEPIAVSPALHEILDCSLYVSTIGATYFNPLCGSLSELWKESLRIEEVPSDEFIAQELNKINSSSIALLDDDRVQRLGDATIDLGGIAKGYALDLVQNYLSGTNTRKYLINAGSSSILLGEKNSNSGYFNVGINDLNGAYLKLKNCFISTSSKSVQGVTIDGVTYSHIVNPVTGSAINENDAVIVVSDCGYYSDALSTSMMMNTIEEIEEIERTHEVRTIVIKDGEIIHSHKDLKVYYH